MKHHPILLANTLCEFGFNYLIIGKLVIHVEFMYWLNKYRWCFIHFLMKFCTLSLFENWVDSCDSISGSKILLFLFLSQLFTNNQYCQVCSCCKQFLNVFRLVAVRRLFFETIVEFFQGWSISVTPRLKPVDSLITKCWITSTQKNTFTYMY